MRLRNLVNIFACGVVAGGGMRRRRWTLSDVGIMFRRVFNVSGLMNCCSTAGEDEDEEDEEEEEESKMGAGVEDGDDDDNDDNNDDDDDDDDDDDEEEGGGACTASGADDNDTNNGMKSIQSRTDRESHASDGRVVNHQH